MSKLEYKKLKANLISWILYDVAEVNSKEVRKEAEKKIEELVINCTDFQEKILMLH